MEGREELRLWCHPAPDVFIKTILTVRKLKPDITLVDIKAMSQFLWIELG